MTCVKARASPLAYAPKAALAAALAQLADTAQGQPKATASFFAGTACLLQQRALQLPC